MKKVYKKLSGLLLAGFGMALPVLASAHVGYVVTHDDFVSHEGSDVNFLLSGFREAPKAAFLAAIIALVIVFLIFFIRSRQSVKAFLLKCKERVSGYTDLLEWIARLSVGIALIGAGTANAFISPLLSGSSAVGLLEILVGFMLLLGFLLTPAYIVAIVLYATGVFQSAYLIGNLDFLALLMAGFALSNARPGLDDILGIGAWNMHGKIKQMAPLILRIGLGSAFIFLAVYEKLLNPHDSELVVQAYNLMHVIPVPASLWVLGAGMIELVLGILLVLGLEVRLVSIVAFLVISLSFFYFKESVYSHVTLFGALSMLLITGAGKWSIDSLLEKNKTNLQ